MYKIKLCLLIFFLCFIPLLLAAQTDSTYIEAFKERVALRGYMSRDFMFLNQGFNSQNETFLPNNPSSIGVGISLYNTIIDFSYGYGFDFFRDKKKGKTKSFDFQLHNYSRKFLFDISVQRYKGFYTEDLKENVALFPDLTIHQYGLHGQYIFNNKRFSYKAAFNQNEKQRKSSGSFLLGGGVYLTKINADSSFVHEGKNAFRNFQFGVSGGYAYTWILSKSWLISASTTVGINFGSEKFSKFGKQKLEVYPTVFPRISVGYNKNSWSLGLSYVGNMLFLSMPENRSLNIISGTAKLTYTKRINNIPFISKIMGL